MDETPRVCEVYSIPQRDRQFRWKWRQLLDDGRVIESEVAFDLYYECIADARAHGYQPEMKCA
jgi:hypothetical protein